MAPFVGIQIGPHSLFDEGIEQCLDSLRERAGVNALFVYSHTYYGGAPADGRGYGGARPMPRVWIDTHERFYRTTALRHPRRSASERYAGRDILTETLGPARERGMKLYVRLFDPCWGDGALGSIRGWQRVLSVDVFGRPYPMPCFTNPDYRAWWRATAEELFSCYAIDGLKYGAERGGPLRHLLFGGMAPGCFCDHCVKRAREEGIDVDAARRGFAALYECTRSQWEDDLTPTDGAMVTLLRLLIRHPAVLQWESLMCRCREELPRLLYGTIKALRGKAELGLHVHHGVSCWDILDRAENDYAAMTEYADWIKPCVYHDVAGPRTLEGYVRTGRRGMLRDLSEQQSLELLYAITGLDATREPRADELHRRGFSSEYVYHEVKRCVTNVDGRVPVYAGVGFDVPHNGHPCSTTDSSQDTYDAARAAFDAGASGLLLSREYDEMRPENLDAVGAAVRDARAAPASHASTR